MPPPKKAEQPKAAAEIGAALVAMIERAVTCEDQLLDDAAAAELLGIKKVQLSRMREWLLNQGARVIEMPGTGRGKKPTRRWSRLSLLNLPRSRWDAPKPLREAARSRA